MAILTREAILKAEDLKVETVACPEWGGDVLVRSMRGVERDAFESSLFTGEGESRKFTATNVRAKLLVRSLVNEAGELLFNEADLSALGDRNAAPLDRLYDVAQRLSGISKTDLDGAVKN